MPGWAPRFLKAYAACGEVKTACAAANIARCTHYDHLKNNALYRGAVEVTEEQVGGMLEDLAVERVREGRLVLYQGAPVEVNGEFLREYDTALHITLLKRFKPAYRERVAAEVSGSIDLVTALTQARNRMVTIDGNTRKAG